MAKLREYGKVADMAVVWTTLDISTQPVTHSPTNVLITKNIIRGIMTVLIWGALVLEAFLAFWVASSVQPADFTEGENDVVFSSNGATKKQAHSSS